MKLAANSHLQAHNEPFQSSFSTIILTYNLMLFSVTARFNISGIENPLQYFCNEIQLIFFEKIMDTRSFIMVWVHNSLLAFSREFARESCDRLANKFSIILAKLCVGKFYIKILALFRLRKAIYAQRL